MKANNLSEYGLQRGLLPFGTAQIMPGKAKYSYFVSPALFYKFLGRPLPLKYQEKPDPETYKVVTDPAMARELVRGWRN